MRTKLSLTYLLILVTSQLAYSQSLTQFIGVTDNSHSVSEFSLSYSVGEVGVSSYINGNYFLTQGFQQSYISIPETVDSIHVVSVQPNPVRTNLLVDFFISGESNFIVEVFNMSGIKKLQVKYSGVVYSERKTLNLENLQKGLYLVRIYSPNGKVSEVFKVEKM